jgi:hypothetical protein
MDVVRLRTMTEKSVFQSGKYEGLSVHQVLSLNRDYLAYAYYTYEGISFCNEILERLGITEDLRIPKPSRDEEKFKEYKKRMFGELIESCRKDGSTEEIAYIKARKIMSKKIKNEIFRRIGDNNMMKREKSSKLSMQRYNQGHFDRYRTML